MAMFEIASLGAALVVTLAPPSTISAATSVQPVSYMKPLTKASARPAVPRNIRPEAPTNADGDRFRFDSCGCSGG